MKQSTDYAQNNTKKTKYVSCIKINGVPILPPLITSEKRKELRRYRREAIKVEKRLQRENELKDYISQLYRTCSTEFDNDGLNTTIDSIVEQVEASNFNDNNENVEISNEELLALIKSQSQHNTSLGERLASSRNDKAGEKKLSCNIQASQYVANEFQECFDNSKSSLLLLINGEDKNEIRDEIIEETVTNVEHNEVVENKERVKTPKLIRSNSYIVDAPSPALVEYLKAKDGHRPSYCWGAAKDLSPKPKESTTTEIKDECDEISEFVDKIHDVSCSNFDTSSKDSTVINQPQIFVNDLQISSIDGETLRRPNHLARPASVLEPRISILDVSDCYDTSRSETELRNLSDCESHIPLSDKDNVPEFIVNNVPCGEDLDESNISVANSKTVLSEIGTNADLNCILRKIPAEYSRRILDILERHQFTNYIADRFEDIQLEPEKYSTPHETSGLTETIYYSVDDGDESTLREQEYINKQKAKEQRTHKDMLIRSNAANILCAATKGFLVRRLMKTEKVQHLIQTIKDTLTCAVDLHKDTIEYIEEADVELHRRLIQQVSAACCAFHDVFFSTSIQDQMSFIAIDRQKKREKLRRLLSGSSISSSKSTSRIVTSKKTQNKRSRK